MKGIREYAQIPPAHLEWGSMLLADQMTIPARRPVRLDIAQPTVEQRVVDVGVEDGPRMHSWGSSFRVWEQGWEIEWRIWEEWNGQGTPSSSLFMMTKSSIAPIKVTTGAMAGMEDEEPAGRDGRTLVGTEAARPMVLTHGRDRAGRWDDEGRRSSCKGWWVHMGEMRVWKRAFLPHLPFLLPSSHL
jgi:hypothetical protein